jgi:DNA-directed RNA polymerase subunit RPC12/RpoP
MAAMIVITCPDCKKQLKGPDELVGKKVRCKSCSHIFTVKAAAEPPAKKTAPVATKSKSAPAPTAKSTANAAVPPTEKKAEGLPYQLTDIVLSPRCPQCAADMREEDILCLNCGYNTQTRVRMQSLRTYETTAADYLVWLLPGVLCALSALLCLGAIVFIWLVLRRWEEDAWYAHKFFQFYGTAMFGWIGWKAGKFAFRRLILHPSPPEKIRHEKD